MHDLTPDQINKLDRLANFVDDKEFGVFEELVRLNTKIGDTKTELIDRINGISEELKKKLESELVLEINKEELIGERGEDYVLTGQDKEEIATLASMNIVVPIVEKVIEKTEVIRETPIVTENIVEVAKYKTPEQTRDDIESLKSDERLDVSAIKGLELKRFGKVSDVERLDRAISIVDNRTSFLINKVNTLAANPGGAVGSFIKTDGTSTTTAPIPFALGLTSAGNVTIDDGIQSKFLTVGNVGTLGQGFSAALYKKDRITFSVDDTEEIITDTILHTSRSIYTFSSSAVGIGSFTLSPLKFSFTSMTSSPPDFIFCGADGTGTNQNGQTLQLSSGRSTGAGTANVAIFAAPSGASGAALNTATSVATFSTKAMTLAEAVDIVTGTTTGTKIGAAANQRIGIWGATPIVQPTTSVAAATFVANTSGIANDTATFDGYTLGKVVKALRNMGILA